MSFKYISTENRYHYNKTINFHGLNVTVPRYLKWAAVSQSGELVFYSHKPIPTKLGWKFEYDMYVESLLIADVKYSGDWKESLEEI